MVRLHHDRADIVGKYTLILRPHVPKLALGTIAHTAPTLSFEPLAAFKCVSVRQNDVRAIITIKITKPNQTDPAEIDAFECVMSAVNDARLVDLEFRHDVDSSTLKNGVGRYEAHAFFHRLRNPNLRRLRLPRLVGCQTYLPSPAARGLQTLVTPRGNGTFQRDSFWWVGPYIEACPSLLDVCTGLCSSVRDGNVRCKCWDGFKPEYRANGMFKYDYGKCARHARKIRTVHHRRIKRTQVAAMTILAVSECVPLPPELWDMVGEHLEANGSMDLRQFRQARELVPLASLSQRTHAMRSLEGEEFVDALEEWLSAEGFSYGIEGGQTT